MIEDCPHNIQVKRKLLRMIKSMKKHEDCKSGEYISNMLKIIMMCNEYDLLTILYDEMLNVLEYKHNKVVFSVN